MKNERLEEGIISRYVVKKSMGKYPPWQGFGVTDSLSDKDYLLFSLIQPRGLSISLDDLKMRDHLFSKDGGVAPPTLSMQKNGKKITFLLPHARLIPLKKALPSMEPDKALELLRVLLSQILMRLQSGLLFHNLTVESIVVINGALSILPTAYLLPGDTLKHLKKHDTENVKNDLSLYGDFNSIGGILEIFCKYIVPEQSDTCRALAQRLRAICDKSDKEDLFSLIDDIGSFFSISDFDPLLLTMRKPPHVPFSSVERTFLQAAAIALEGRKTLTVVRGERGCGKTRFLDVMSGKLRDELGFKEGSIISDQSIFQNMELVEVPENIDFIMMDDHVLEKHLDSFFICRLSQYIAKCKLVVIAVNETPPKHFMKTLEKIGDELDVTIEEITLPSPGKEAKRNILAGLLPGNKADQWLGMIEPGHSLALMCHDLKCRVRGTRRGKKKPARNFLDVLGREERAILNFLTVFRFELPLSILQNIYSTEEDGIYTILQQLVAKGLVTARSEASTLAGNDLCLVYSLSSRSLADVISRSIPAARKKQIHRNIVPILKQIKNPLPVYIFYHLVTGDEHEEAALKGYELFQMLLRKKKQSAINCFNKNYLEEKLDSFLPPGMRFTLLLELGNYFSLIGKMATAGALYRRCREKTSEESMWKEFRSQAVEAIRKECEILEKRGEFLKAKRLLNKTLDTHGEHILANERAKLYNDLAWTHYRLGQFSKSWENCLLVHKLLDKKQYPVEIAQAYNMMGTINWNRSRYDDAILCYKRCLGLREESGDEIGVATSFNNLGLAYRSMGRVKEALECFKKSMTIKQSHNNLPGLAAVHLNIALAYLDMEKLKEAETNCLMASNLAAEIGNQQLLAETYGTLGEIHSLQKNYDKARDYYFQDLHICHKTSSLREKAVVFRRLGELSLAEKKITETKGLLKQARTLNQKIGSRLETALLNLLEGRILLASGKREQGNQKLEGASLELSLLGRKNIAASIAAEIGNLYLEASNEPLAHEYLLRAISLSGEEDPMPAQIQVLMEKLDRQASMSLDQIKSDSDRFKALCRIISLIRTIHDPEKLYKTITETARKITGMKRAALILQSDGKETFRILAASGGFDTGSVLTDRNIIAILNMARQLGYPLDILRTSIPNGQIGEAFLREHQSIICTPLWIQDEVTGFLYLDSPVGTTGTTDKDHSFLVALSQQVALGLERIILSDKVKHSAKSRPSGRITPGRSRERAAFQDIIGNSPSIKRIFDLIDGIKDMETTVLLTGESGSGKDLIAKTIHYTSSRSEKPFHSLNCAAIPRELIESELFGYERGAFTGAHRLTIGHFESANGGTIFLNEIGELPLNLQPKLLRVLEDRKFYRVGGTKEISTDVKIIAATNKDLHELVKTGKFREDLYYRINIFPIRVPSLKERKEDIELISRHFLTSFSRLYNIPEKKISPEAMAYLVNFDWPGNVRELENVINRMMIIVKSDTILPENLPDNIVQIPEGVRTEEKTSLEETVEQLLDNTPFSESDPLLPKIEGMIIRKVVDRVGAKTRAASCLGMSKPTLYSKLKNYEKNRG